MRSDLWLMKVGSATAIGLACLLPTACTSPSHYAPLLPRAYEADNYRFGPPAPSRWQAKPADGDTRAAIRAALLEADEGNAAFEKALIRARAIKATEGAAPSIEAQEALSGLAAAREPTQHAASDLDQLEVNALNDDGIGLQALRATRALVGEKIAAQDAKMANLAR